MADLRQRLAPLACATAGAAGVLAFSPHDLWLLAPVTLAVLFYCAAHRSPVAAFRLGYLFGVGLFGAGVGWLHISINLFGGLGLIPSLAVTFLVIAYMALFPALSMYAGVRIARGATPSAMLLVFPALWMLGEWLRAWLFTGFPWLIIGYSQIDSPLGALAPVTGVYGISMAVAVLAGSLVLLICARGLPRTAAALATFFLVGAGLGLGKAHWTRATDVTRSVALVQGAVPPEVRWRPEFLTNSVERYVNLTMAHWDKDIIIWPETAIPAFASQLPDLLRDLGSEAARNDADFYLGLPITNADGSRYYNSLLLLGGSPGTYRKRHLVPFGEFIPLEPVFRSFGELLNIPMSNFTRGPPDRPLLRGANAIAGVSICYEDTFGEEVLQALPDAGILINVSNDGWFGDSAAPHQHLQMARMRARETGRYLLRATNSGVSAIIAADGTIESRLPQFQAAVLTGNARLYEGMTPYARTGNWPVLVLATALIALFCRWRNAVAVDYRTA